MSYARFLITLISVGIEIYVWLILARAILSFIRPRTYHPIIRFIYETTEPLLALCRRFLPGPAMGLDFSPLLAIIILEVVKYILINLVARLFL